MYRLFLVALLAFLAGCETTEPTLISAGAGPSELSTQSHSQVEDQEYVSRLRRWIKRHMEYPASSKLHREEGDVVVGIVIARDGTIVSKEVLKSSGFSNLDQAALDMLERSSPVPPLPKQFPRETARAVLPFRFDLLHNTVETRDKERTYAEEFGDDVAGALECGHHVEAERYMRAVKSYLEECSGASDAEIEEIMAIYGSAKPAACSEVKLTTLRTMAIVNMAFVEVGC